MKIKIPDRKKVEDIGELVLENRDAIYISMPRGQKTVQMIGVALNKAGELIVSFFQPVKVIKHYNAKRTTSSKGKKKVHPKSEAGHE